MAWSIWLCGTGGSCVGLAGEGAAGDCVAEGVAADMCLAVVDVDVVESQEQLTEGHACDGAT